jgi:hypothetical protein
MEYAKNNLLSLIILLALAVFFIMFFKGCFQPTPQPTVTVKRDTIYSVIQSHAPVQSQPIVIAAQQPTPGQTNTIREIIYKNDTTAIKQILERYYSKSSYKDVLKIDSIGTVQVNDTVSENKIVGRSYTYALKYPVITNTVTIKEPYKPTNKLLYGAGVSGNAVALVNQFNAGIALQNRKDDLFVLNATLSKYGIGGEVLYYHKLSFRK